MHVFALNGFEITEGPDNSLQLSAVPFSKNTTFDRTDVQELVQILTHSGVPPSQREASSATQRLALNVHGKLPRPSRCARFWLSSL